MWKKSKLSNCWTYLGFINLYWQKKDCFMFSLNSACLLNFFIFLDSFVFSTMSEYLAHSSALYHGCVGDHTEQTDPQSWQPRTRAYCMSPCNTVFQVITFHWVVFLLSPNLMQPMQLGGPEKYSVCCRGKERCEREEHPFPYRKL